MTRISMLAVVLVVVLLLCQDCSEEYFAEVRELDEKPIQIIIRNNHSLLIRAEQKIWRCNIYGNILHKLYEGVINAMRYDNTDDRVFILTPTHLKAISASWGLQLNSFPLQEEFTDVHFFYNR